ncbi:MAG TPA: hypothetical protein VFM38_10830, partial [Candidatus Limnocylindrales bacterium]|nr:hypothetical protein [Candidatus Limnocylindrales bacterium]
MIGLRHLGRMAIVASITAMLFAACAGSTPTAAPTTASSTSPSASDGAPAASGLIDFADATDPVAGARAELDLTRQLRDEAGLPALLGTGGADAFAALDALEARFGEKLLQDAAAAAEGRAALARPSPATPSRIQLAMARGVPPAARLPSFAIDTSVFADTGFTTSALMQLFAGIVRLAGQESAGSLPRQEHFTDESGGFRQDVDLGSTITVMAGGGHVSGDVQLTATDRISRSDGTFVALYTSTAHGHFDVNACPDGGGIGAGTYSFETKHELNDVGGSANVRSGAGRSVTGPFQLQNGDDANLQKVSASLDLAADANGPGSPAGPGPTGPFDGTASQKVDIVMPTTGETTVSGQPATVTGTGGAAASGSLFVSQALAQLFLAAVGKEAERFWQSGECVELKPSRDTGTVDPEEKIDLTVTAKAKFGDGGEISAPITAAFAGKESLDPHDQPKDPPAHFAFKAGKDEGDKGTIDLKQTSRRGIGKKQVIYTVSGKPLLVSVTSKSVANIGVTITYQGSITDLKLARSGDAYQGSGSMKVTITLKLTAPKASCTGTDTKTYDVGVKAAPVPKPSDQPNAKDELDLSFDYPVGGVKIFTITCKTKEGTASGPAPWEGLMSVLPLPGEAHRVTVGVSTALVVPGSPPINVTITVKK